MDYLQELVPHNAALPFNCFLWGEEKKHKNWHNDIELLFILQGTVYMEIKQQSYVFHKEDLVLINPFDFHEITRTTSDVCILALHLDTRYYEAFYPEMASLTFKCNSVIVDKPLGVYESLKHKLLNLHHNILLAQNYYQLNGLQQSIDLVLFLIKHFSLSGHSDDFSPDLYQERLARILKHLNENYMNRITLTSVAETEYLTSQYLSKFFKSYMGIGFSQYLNKLRLMNSIKLLQNTNLSILEVSIQSGFSNPKTYGTLFKQTFHVTPSQYRKQPLIPENKMRTDLAKSFDDNFLIFKNYYNAYLETQLSSPYSEPTYVNIDADTQTDSSFQFEKILRFDFVYDGLNANWQKNLKEIQSEVDFDFIRFGGIFSNGMYFYDEKENSYNWFNINALLDFFLEIQLKPFLELSIGDHIDINEWHNLLIHFLNHCINRYGIAEVQTWRFELSSENKSYDKAIHLYTTTLNRLSDKYQNLSFGILFVPAEDFEKREYLRNFIDKNIKFMSIEMEEAFYFKKYDLVQQLFDNISNTMGLKAYFFKKNQINFLNDTNFEACHYLYQKLVPFQSIDTQLVFIDDMKSTKLFHGGWGALTYNGFKKPMYNVFYFLTRIMGVIIEEGPGYFITRSHHKIFLILYNYNETYANFYRDHKRDYSRVSYRGVKSAFPNTQKRQFIINLVIDENQYRITKNILNESDGSIYTAWVEMGCPKKLTSFEYKYLESKEFMRMNISHIQGQKVLEINETIEFNEMKCYEITAIQ